ncbi:2,3-bisphosphoglycerate-dependent phosphoglycerate mutase [Agrilactobacillus fermenti]|uniref:2,3-bisphosphoglycerate-dependent phosphoglycerate mutase n=1 Tax=Agrilactobacillus fermenti TaxID=2586909 RepID=UPI001E41746F|nr:2,3-diphosphoglycerate-dependent phosphoglycerate mutase [Agrilactobacillus fermenti]MCD2255403.1 2,3-diphosphoglycerate-dependent phosphoglycerate mutase [Agrilactobacillus fermenti]
MSHLVLVRHGESVANQQNVYTGWSDVPLTLKGKQEAQAIGKKLAEFDFKFRACHTSVLQRAIMTSYLILDALNLNDLPLYKSWRLNERHYGALRGLNKDDTRQLFGKQQVQRWRRSFTSVPPLLSRRDQDRRYAQLTADCIPRGESLQMAANRLDPYYQEQIAPKLRLGKDQLVVAHGSSLRAMIKYIEQISDADIDGVEVANGEAIVYQFDAQLNLQRKMRIKANI